MAGAARTTRIARSVVALCAVAAPATWPAAAGQPTGAELAAAAVEAMGGAEAVAALDSLAVSAECSGPNGAFSSFVSWRREGPTLLRQSDDGGRSDLLAVGDRAWKLDPGGGPQEPLPEGTATMVRGHAVHPTLFELDRRFRDHHAAGTGAGGCLRIEMLDADDRPASVCLDPETMLPAEFSFTPPGPAGEIEMRLSGWRRFGELLYFTAFTLRQGDEEYRWVYGSIRPNASDSGPPAGARATAGVWEPGAKISMSLKDADLGDVLRTFAQLAGFNLVLDPSVRGAVTVEFQDVSWEQALEVILETHGLAAEVDGKAWRVRPR